MDLTYQPDSTLLDVTGTVSNDNYTEFFDLHERFNWYGHKFVNTFYSKTPEKS